MFRRYEELTKQIEELESVNEHSFAVTVDRERGFSDLLMLRVSLRERGDGRPLKLPTMLDRITSERLALAVEQAMPDIVARLVAKLKDERAKQGSYVIETIQRQTHISHAG